MNFRDTLERMFWTISSASLSSIAFASFTDLKAWEAAAVAGGTAATNFLLIVARKRLSILPDPGAGLGPQ